MQLITINEQNIPTTTSLMVAEVFGKRHRDVLRSIRQTYIPKDFNERNFALVEYTDEKGEQRPMYEMTKDGFVLLAMGFTGKKAMDFKVKYIEAFNEMERKLREIRPNEKPVLASPDLALVGGTVKRCVKTAVKDLFNNSTQEFVCILNKWDTKRAERISNLEEENAKYRDALSKIGKIILG